MAWGGRATVLPGATENGKLYGCVCGFVWVAFGSVGDVPGQAEAKL